MDDTYGLVVIGGGPAGLAAARAYRAAGGERAVAIVADEHRVPYSRPPLSKEFLRGEVGASALPIESAAWLSEHEIALVQGRAVELDPDLREVSLSGGRALRYRRCVLATGAEPARLPVPGADDPAVRTLRTLDDVRELEQRLEPGTAAVVIGSGFIGCEIAASLRIRGHQVTMFSDEPAPNARRLGREAAERIAGWLAADGVRLELGAEVERIDRAGELLHVTSVGVGVTVPLVVMATGVAPRTELARAAGLTITSGAIAVDSSMRTSAAGLFAAGDVAYAQNEAAGRALRVEHWGEALRQGEVAGRVAAGRPDAWSDVPGFWSTIGTRTLKYAAWGDGFDADELSETADGFTVAYGRQGRLVGLLAHGADDAYDAAAERIANGAPWP